jgi:plasmid stabilization system protein ParE
MIICTNVLSQQITKCKMEDGKISYVQGSCPINAATVKAIPRDYQSTEDAAASVRSRQELQVSLDNLQKGPRSANVECDEALASYRSAAKRHSMAFLPISPEAVTVKAKCGVEPARVKQVSRPTSNGVLTKQVVQGMHRICIYSDGSSVSKGGAEFCDLSK